MHLGVPGKRPALVNRIPRVFLSVLFVPYPVIVESEAHFSITPAITLLFHPDAIEVNGAFFARSADAEIFPILRSVRTAKGRGAYLQAVDVDRELAPVILTIAVVVKGRVGNRHVVPGLAGQDITSDVFHPLAASAKTNPDLAALHLQGRVSILLTAVLAQDALPVIVERTLPVQGVNPGRQGEPALTQIQVGVFVNLNIIIVPEL